MKTAWLIIRGHDSGIRVAMTESPRERMRGLLGRDRLTVDEALLLARCRSIHTFGMRFAIDVLFLDQQRRVVSIRHDVPPARMRFSLRGRHTLEMPAGAARARSIAIGDTLDFKAAA